MCWWRTGVGQTNSNKLVKPQCTTWSSPPCFSNLTHSARNKRHCSLCRFSKLACHLKGRTNFFGSALLMRSCVALSAKLKAFFLLSLYICSGFHAHIRAAEAEMGTGGTHCCSVAVQQKKQGGRNCRSVYSSVTCFLETGQNHFKQQQNPVICNLTNLLWANQSCRRRTCASKG